MNKTLFSLWVFIGYKQQLNDRWDLCPCYWSTLDVVLTIFLFAGKRQEISRNEAEATRKLLTTVFTEFTDFVRAGRNVHAFFEMILDFDLNLGVAQLLICAGCGSDIAGQQLQVSISPTNNRNKIQDSPIYVTQD